MAVRISSLSGEVWSTAGAAHHEGVGAGERTAAVTVAVAAAVHALEASGGFVHVVTSAPGGFRFRILSSPKQGAC